MRNRLNPLLSQANAANPQNNFNDLFADYGIDNWNDYKENILQHLNNINLKYIKCNNVIILLKTNTIFILQDKYLQ